MRIMWFCIPAFGHTNPTVEVVRELTARGHEIRYYSFEDFRQKLQGAGAVFIPMDPEYPRDRIEQILTDSEAALIITDVPQVAEGFAEKCVAPSELNSADDSRPDVAVTPDDMCFIIYTSGTTGRPKGVVLFHRGISNYIAPEPENAPIYALAKRCHGMLCLSSVSFIVFLREIFGTILNLSVDFSVFRMFDNTVGLNAFLNFRGKNAAFFGVNPVPVTVE